MALCEVLIENDDDCYTGDYTEEKNILSVDINNYSDFVSGIEFSNEIKYKSIAIKDYKNKVFAFSPIFHNTGSTYGLSLYESYKTDFYFSTGKVENISEFNKDIKIKAITFYHPMLINYFLNPCLCIETTSDYYQYKVKRTGIDKKEIGINKNNISKIVISGNYSLNDKNQHQNIDIKTENFICILEINYQNLGTQIQAIFKD